MNKHSIGEKFVTFSTVLGFALPLLILLYEIIDTQGIVFFNRLHRPALCTALLVRGIWGRKYTTSCTYKRNLRLTYPLIFASIAAFLALSYLIRYVRYFMISLSMLNFLYVLTLPVSVLFLVGILLRGNPGQNP